MRGCVSPAEVTSDSSPASHPDVLRVAEGDKQKSSAEGELGRFPLHLSGPAELLTRSGHTYKPCWGLSPDKPPGNASTTSVSPLL